MSDDEEEAEEALGIDEQPDTPSTASTTAASSFSFFNLLFYGWADDELRLLLSYIAGFLQEHPIMEDAMLVHLRHAELPIPPLPELLGPLDRRASRPLIVAVTRFSSSNQPTLDAGSPLSEIRRTWRRAILLACFFRCQYVRELFLTDNVVAHTILRLAITPRSVYLPFLEGVGPLVDAFQRGLMDAAEMTERARSLWLTDAPQRMPRYNPLPDELIRLLEDIGREGAKAIPPHTSPWAT